MLSDFKKVSPQVETQTSLILNLKIGVWICSMMAHKKKIIQISRGKKDSQKAIWVVSVKMPIWT